MALDVLSRCFLLFTKIKRWEFGKKLSLIFA